MLIFALRITMFVSAFLLFWCQPMVARMVLPLLGGSASVWTTCVLFFQVMLLAGYVYAHLLGRLPDIRKQLLLHGILTILVLGFIPISFLSTAGAAPSAHPAGWLLLQLVRAVGVPFFVVSTTAPLIQTWLARTSSEAGGDPYFLYAASNAGSLISLVIYPLLVEPRLGLAAQTRLWSIGYLTLMGLLAASAAMILKSGGSQEPIVRTSRPALKDRAYWTAAAFVPSALMLAVTTHISVNLASVPFLWIVPLGVYLLTFILAFARSWRISAARLSWLSPLVFAGLLLLVPDAAPMKPAYNWLLMAAHVGGLFFGALLCHTSLAERRPAADHLTEFYFWIALGGAFGGAFTALIAPAIFKTVFEYPLLVATLPFFRAPGGRKSNRIDWIVPAVVGIVFFAVSRTATVSILPDIGFFIVLLAICRHRVRFGLTFAVLLIGYTLTLPAFFEDGERLTVARNFFGVKKVLFDKNEQLRRLIHGEILHGVESTDPLQAGIPLSYYHPTGPVGDVMSVIGDRPGQTVAVVGLGTGSVAAYGGPNRQITFYDVDPQVESIAREYFTFLKKCAENCSVVIGDGRLSIERVPDRTFDLILLDAFSSDSIPAHLVSREAMKIYRAKLKPNGVLLFHVSNRYLSVGKLVAAVTLDAGLVAYLRSDREPGGVLGKTGSDYAVAAPHLSNLGVLPLKGTWVAIDRDPSVRPWTDDYSNMLGLLKWRD